MRWEDAEALRTFESLDALSCRLAGYAAHMREGAAEIAARTDAAARQEVAALDEAAADFTRASEIAGFLARRADRLELLREPVLYKPHPSPSRLGGASSTGRAAR